MTASPLEKALAQLGVLHEINMTLAPLSPTRHMIQAAAESTGLDEETVKAAYHAMLETYAPVQAK